MNADNMHPILVEPSDTFFFRDSIPMSAGQGRGAGARWPLPSTFHEALRASLFEKHGRSMETAAFRPKEAPRTGGWLGQGKSVTSHGSKDYQSLQVSGPFPYLLPGKDSPGGLYFPLPLDLVFEEQNETHSRNEWGKAHTLQLLALECAGHSAPLPAVTVSPIPGRKAGPSGFLSAEAMNAYLTGDLAKLESKEAYIAVGKLFEPEHRIGVAIDESSQSAVNGQLYSATHARPTDRFRFAAWTGLKRPLAGEVEKLQQLEFLIFGGERRISRIHREKVTLPVPTLPSLIGADGPAVLKWSLVTPTVFAHGSLPGWCRDTSSSARPEGEVCLPLSSGRAHLIATCQGKPLAFAGWDVVAQQSKPTQLAVPAGSVFYFLCENSAVAHELGVLLHWRPRSDVFGEKGFGYGLCSFATQFHLTSPDVRTMASKLFV